MPEGGDAGGASWCPTSRADNSRITKIAASGPNATMRSASSRVRGRVNSTGCIGDGVSTPPYYAHTREKEQYKIRFSHVFLENSFHLAEVLPHFILDTARSHFSKAPRMAAIR